MIQAEWIKVQHEGIVLDLPPEEVDPAVWTGGKNVVFRDGITERVGGYERFANPLPVGTPLYAMNVLIGPESYWIYMTVTKVYVTDGVTHWNITPGGAGGDMSVSQAGDWSTCILNGIPCMNNGHDAPIYWNLNTASPCQTLPGWPASARCKALRASKYHLIALNITDAGINYGSQVWWSAGAQAGALPTEWTPTASNDAGDVICADTPGVIIDGLALRDTFMVYKETSTYVMQYVAGQYVFTTRKLFLTTGAVALNCVVEANGMHWVLTGTDVVRHDGQNFTSVVDQKVQRTLIQSIEPSKRKMCCVEARILNKQVWVCIPEANQSWLTKAYVIDVKSGDVGVRSLPNVASVAHGVVASVGSGNSWNADPNPWSTDVTFWDQQSYDPSQDSLLMVDAVNARLYNIDTIGTADGAPVHAYIERLGGMLGDFVKHKVMTALVPRIEGEPGDLLTITLGGQPWFDQPITWGEPQPFVIGTDVGVTDIVEGRLLSVRIEGTTPSVWRLYKYSVKAVEQGEV